LTDEALNYVVYTCVFGDYDWTFPPLVRETALSYIIMTDNPGLRVPGWDTRLVDARPFRNPKTANLHYRALSHQYLGNFDCALYLDGNIRLLGKTSELIAAFQDTGSPLGLFRHPLRGSVREESACCLENGKILETDRLQTELDYQARNGFPDKTGLVETTIMLKNHRSDELADAMQLWWTNFEAFGTRDQIGLPYVLWKKNVLCQYQPFSFREKNPYFGRYAHKHDKRAPRHFAYIEGRSYDSVFFATILRLWKFTWAVRRLFRRHNG
jgi:hypothetical protein